MVRKSTQSHPTNASEGIEMILANEPLKTVSEAAEFLGVAEIRILELFSDALNLPEAMGWEVIPQEHQHLLNEFKAEAINIQALPEVTAETTPLPRETPIEPQVIQQEQTPAKRRGRPRKESTALTQTKSTKLKESDQKAQQLAASDQQVKVALHARKGQKSGAQLATIELAAEDATYRQVKGQALVRKVGQLTSEIASESGFDPIQVLAELGIDSNSNILEDLCEHIEPALGKLESATAEIVDNAWLNGIDLGAELGNLESLMNCNGSTSDYWQ
jgi:hypothetical protein